MSNIYNVENFDENGIAWPYSLKIKHDISEFETQYFRYKENSQKHFGKDCSLKPHLLSKFFYDLAVDESILNNIKKIIGENIYIWSSAFFAKAPGEGKIVSFHQDNPYWQLTTTKVVTAWIALTSSNKKSGALQAVPRSHGLGLLNKLDVENPRKSYLKGEKTTVSNDMLSYNQNLDEFVKKNPPLIINLNPGEFSIHHVNTVHGSGINESKDYRIGFAVRYVSSETQHFEEDKDFATHISGNKNNYYQDEISAKEEFSESEISQYKISMESTGVFGNKKY